MMNLCHSAVCYINLNATLASQSQLPGSQSSPDPSKASLAVWTIVAAVSMQVAALHSSMVVLGGVPLARRPHAAVKPGGRCYKGAVAFKEEEVSNCTPVVMEACTVPPVQGLPSASSLPTAEAQAASFLPGGDV